MIDEITRGGAPVAGAADKKVFEVTNAAVDNDIVIDASFKLGQPEVTAERASFSQN